MFSGENKGKGKIAKSEKKTGKRCDLENSSAAEMAVYGYCLCCSRAVVTALIPPLILAKIGDTVTAGKSRDILGDFLFILQCLHLPDSWNLPGRSAYRIWAENHTCT